MWAASEAEMQGGGTYKVTAVGSLGEKPEARQEGKFEVRQEGLQRADANQVAPLFASCLDQQA